ncbi:phosphoglycerol transferase MdoB-like AlkP superfamily enzyme [Cerasibacillus quisquiliarum]|uniref:Uncharacterized protein n=1 Tax=Cerasibacillus quisquiliarum TaxID=227865 RepID=A0A511UYX2_9BACI|nr:hypothetical protein [Cerasibacillus quisquiliarum]MBB5146347.1 phosphoglycerol transferase MdoB-like AlkP superfamily enzyme [Cerasibacillus quisquiliarum]GEN30673.1 hypothetical protein CQU01_09110 [Cerasibacillus quisquiliarum]
MELAIKGNKFSRLLSLFSFGLGLINLLSLNIAISIQRNIFPSYYLYIVILGVISGVIALFLKTNSKGFTILGLLMNLLTGLTIICIIVFSFSINPSP